MGGGRLGIDFYVGPNGGVLLAKYKKWIGVNRRDRLLAKANNPKLRKAIDMLYRSGSFIGDGGTASVLKFEKRTGLNVGYNGNSHYQKARDLETYLSKRVLKQNLTIGERKLAEKMIRSLKKSIIEWRS